MLNRLFQRQKLPASERPAAAPPGRRVYAIGDVHGRVDLLEELHGKILQDAATGPRDRSIVYLGDLIDRGPHSRAVLDLLLDRPLPGFRHVHLLGNHEASLLQFLEDGSIATSWLQFGGLATLKSYDLQVPFGLTEEGIARLQAELRAALPDRHLAFLRSLALTHVEGDYLFVHAGLRPGTPLEAQTRQDLTWIRQEFLESEADHGKVVVHGHTICEQIEIKPNRIGIDTGAYYTGQLTCLVLEGAERRFLQT